MTKQEMLDRIDAELARLKALNPIERAALDKALAQQHQTDLIAKVLGR